MSKSIRKLFSGSSATWKVKGSVHVTVLGFLVGANLDNSMVMPAISLQGVQGRNLQPTEGNGKKGILNSDVELTANRR